MVRYKLSGCSTAIITPMKSNGQIDWRGFRDLIDFQAHEGVDGILFCGTTGASPTLTWEEHNSVIATGIKYYGDRGLKIAGTGSNSTAEALDGTKHAVENGAQAILLVDPYYNGPSSLEIRKEYLEPIAEAFPDVEIIPYIIPGRTGTKLSPQQLAIISNKMENVNAVKEATGDIDNMRKTRGICKEGFQIISGDDNLTYKIMTDPEIKACGVISVASNVAPGYITKMVKYLNEGNLTEASKLNKALQPLWDMVTVKTTEDTPYDPEEIKSRNPVPYLTLMNILGMPAGLPRQPLGKMTEKGAKVVLESARKVYENTPWVLKPVEDFFDVDLGKRLYNPKIMDGLVYKGM